jgi:hypothetical protein
LHWLIKLLYGYLTEQSVGAVVFGKKITKVTYLLWFCALASFASDSTATLEEKQPRYAPGVVSIIQEHAYIQKHEAPIYWKISPYYLPQLTDASCSLTAATMVINALRIPQMQYAYQKLATDNSVVHCINTDVWDDSVKQGGDGISLDQFGSYFKLATEAYHIEPLTLEVLHATNATDVAMKFHQALVEGEHTGRTFIIVNFDQKFISGTESVGHFAPIGAYDATTKRVLIMDPDRELFEPYWIPEDLLFKSMATKDSSGLVYRGFIVIRN